MRKDLTIGDLGDLVERPLLAVLGTYRADGTVLLSPVWHEYRDGGFNVCTEMSGVKARHLRGDPRAVLVLAEPEPPYRGVELSTRVRLVGDEIEATALRVAVRYLGSQAGEAFAATAVDDVVIRLEPGKVRAWDFVDDFPS